MKGATGALDCIGDEALAAFAEGCVPPEERGDIELHVADCAECRAVLARISAAVRSRPAPPALDAGEDVPSPELSAGTRVGRYILGDMIGRGAMGAVYAAVDPDLHRKVAVKLLRADALSDDARRAMRGRLLREAQAMARLSHPEVITVHDVGAFGDQLFVAMELVEGETLRRWLSARHREWRQIVAVYERAGSGLAAAHEAGLVHRDFKPDNVLVGHDGRVRVTDFGLARSTGQTDGGVAARPSTEPGPPSEEGPVTPTTLTRTGTLLGTPAYMAPEQLRGGVADARSDVFSFCVALYEALYGERPFGGASVSQLLRAIEQRQIRRPPVTTRVPAWVRTVLLRGMHAVPEERYPSMRALLDGLRAAHEGWRRRRRTVGTASVLVGLAAAWAVYARRPHGVGSAAPTPPASIDVHAVAVDRPAAPSGVEPLERLSATELVREAVAAPAAAAVVRIASAAPPRDQPHPVPPAGRTLRSRAASPTSCQPPYVVDPSTGQRGPKAGCEDPSAVASPAGEPKPLVGNNGAMILE